MKPHLSRCRCCRDVASTLAKRFDKDLGSVCRECYEFSSYSDAVLCRVGIEGSVIDPVRPNPKPEKESP